MTIRRLPHAQDLWTRHVQAVLCVMEGALLRLQARSVLPDDEESLDRLLYFEAREEYFHIPGEERPTGFFLIPKAENTPITCEDVEETWVKAKPDFKWRLSNDLASDPRWLALDLDIECKRLGRPTSKGWILNEQYVINGIERFLAPTHRYGNGVNAGLMIGYVQTMSPEDILVEINRHLTASPTGGCCTQLITKKRRVVNPVVGFYQSLKREKVDPHEFTLHHLWGDLRRRGIMPG